MNDISESFDSSPLTQQVILAFKGHRRLFFQALLIIFIIVVAAAYIKRPSYEASARLLVKLDQRDVSFSQSETRYQIANKMAEEAVATEAEMLGGNNLIAEVVDMLGPDIFKSRKSDNIILTTLSSLYSGVQDSAMNALSSLGLIPSMTPRDKAIMEIKKNLTIFPVRKAQVIELAFRNKNPIAAEKVLSTLIHLHIKKLTELNNYSEDYEFYQRQTEMLKGEVGIASDTLLKFKSQNHLVDLQAEKNMLLQRIDSLTSILDGANLPVSGNPQYNTENPDMQSLTGPVKLAQVGIPQSNGDILQLATRLNDLKIELSRRKTLYESNHALIRELETQITSISVILKKQVTHLVVTINSYKERLALLDQLEPELNRLTGAFTASEEHYRTYSKAAEERRLAKEQESKIIVQVLDQPGLPTVPVSSSRLIFILTGLVAALLVAGTLIIVRQWFELKHVIGRRAKL
jgi:uncharacterized protein involved in exopolysaccharide biosynthesis